MDEFADHAADAVVAAMLLQLEAVFLGVQLRWQELGYAFGWFDGPASLLVAVQLADSPFLELQRLEAFWLLVVHSSQEPVCVVEPDLVGLRE